MRRKCAFLALTWVILMTCIIGVFGQIGSNDSSTSQLKDKRISLKLKHESFGKIVRELGSKYEILIGLEESTLDKDHDDYRFNVNPPKNLYQKDYEMANGGRVSVTAEEYFVVNQHWIDVDAENTRLEEVLDQIVRQMKNYKWEINDGVVNIFPTKGRDERFKELLETEIKSFNMEEKRPVSDIRTMIFARPEIVDFLKEKMIDPPTIREIVIYDRGRLTESLRFSNLKFRDILNRITKIKRGGWVLKPNKLQQDRGTEIIDIDI